MIKSVKKNDIRTTPFTAVKTWNPQNKRHKDLILWQSGSISGSLSLVFKEFNDGTIPPYYATSAISLQQQDDDFVRFREGVNLTGSISPTGSFYYDPILSEKNVDGTYKNVLYATTKHLFYKESQDPTKIFGLESLDVSKVNRSLPNKISTFNIPQNKFGEKVIPSSVEITHEIQGKTFTVIDDGNSNLILRDKTFLDNQDSNTENIYTGNISKISANITLDNFTNNSLSINYDGNPYSVTATTKPSNLNYIITYNDSIYPPTTVGTYTVIASIIDNFYIGSVKGTLIIKESSASITISNLNQTYDGNPKPVIVTTSPSNLSYTVTYNSSKNPPINAGTYAVVVTINDPNYKNSKNATLIVAAKTPNISSICPIKTYGDQDFDIVPNSNSNGSISYTINSGPANISKGKIHITGVGTIDVTVNQSAFGNYLASSINCSITVNPKQLTVSGITANDKAYDSNNTATLNKNAAKLNGVISYSNGTSDSVTLNIAGATGTFSDPTVGEGKLVTISGLTISGVDSSKYTLVQPTTTAAIKSGTGSDTIIMSNITVTYDGRPKKMPVSIGNSNIPILITYSDLNNVILKTERLFNNTLTSLDDSQYPVNIGTYKVTAELDVSVSTATKYTITKVIANLLILGSKYADLRVSNHIFYYDGVPKNLEVIHVFPPNEELIIEYSNDKINYNMVPPTDVGTYYAKISFKNKSYFFSGIHTFFIKNIPTNNCGDKITDDLNTDSNRPYINQRYQKNIINLQNSIGKFEFYFNAKLDDAIQFMIEYPLGSKNIIYDSGLRANYISIGTEVVDEVSNEYLKISGIGTPDNNKPILFNKYNNGLSIDGKLDYDKCLVTVYRPWIASRSRIPDWYYSVGCVNQNSKMADLRSFTFDHNFTFTNNNPLVLQNKPIVYLLTKSDLLNQFTVYAEIGDSYNKATSQEIDAIKRIIESNINNPTTTVYNTKTSFILSDVDSNVKIIVSGIKNDDGSITVGLKYQRVSDSSTPLVNSEPFASDCHFYEYLGNKPSFDLNDAKQVLLQQVRSDSFKNTFIPVSSNISVGENQRYSLIKFIENLTEDQYNNVKFTLNSLSGENLADLILYMNLNTQKVTIIYPSVCQNVDLL